MSDEASLPAKTSIVGESFALGLDQSFNSPGVGLLFNILKAASGGLASPVIDYFRDVVKEKIIESQRKRLREFFTHLESGGIELDESIIQSDDFLYCYFSTVNTVLRTRSLKKIRLFAELLRNGIESHEMQDDPAGYELDEDILANLSEEEIKFMVAYDISGGIKGGAIEQGKFFQDIMGRDETEYPSFILKLNRTGCVSTTAGYGGYTVLVGLSPLFYKIKEKALRSLYQMPE